MRHRWLTLRTMQSSRLPSPTGFYSKDVGKSRVGPQRYGRKCKSTGLMEDVVAESLMSLFLWIDVWRKSLQVWPLEIKTQNTHTDDSLLSQRNIDYICVSQFKAQPQKECTLCMSHESSSKAIVPRRKCEVGGSTRLFWRAIRWKRGGEENNKRNGEIYRGDGEGLWGNYTLKLLFNQLFSVPGY